MTATACPYCAQAHDARMLPTHMAKCPMSPALFDRIKAALDDGTGTIVTSVQYQADTVRRNGLVAANQLFGVCGTWKEVAEVFGLRWENPLTRPKPGYQKPVKTLTGPLLASEHLTNIPGEDEAAMIHSPQCLHAYRVEVSDRVGIVGTPVGDVVMRCVVERMMLR